MKKFAWVIVLILLLATAGSAFAVSIADEDEAAGYLVKYLSDEKLWRESHIVFADGTERINGETCYYIRHAENMPTHVAVIEHYYVSPTGKIYRYDIIMDDYILVK